MPEWGQWLSEQREAAGIKSDGVYVQVPHTKGFLWTGADGVLWVSKVCRRLVSNDGAPTRRCSILNVFQECKVVFCRSCVQK